MTQKINRHQPEGVKWLSKITKTHLNHCQNRESPVTMGKKPSDESKKKKPSIGSQQRSLHQSHASRVGQFRLPSQAALKKTRKRLKLKKAQHNLLQNVVLIDGWWLGERKNKVRRQNPEPKWLLNLCEELLVGFYWQPPYGRTKPRPRNALLQWQQV